MVRIYESILDDWTPEAQPSAGRVLAKEGSGDVYDCTLRIGIGVADKPDDLHYISWMKIDTYREHWRKFLSELFSVLDGRPEIRDIRCDRYMFVDVNFNPDINEDNEIWCDLDDVQPVFDRNRLYYSSDRTGSVFCIDVQMDAGFRRTRQCVTLVRQLFYLFSEERAEKTGCVFWIGSLCAGTFNGIGYNALEMGEKYWGGKLAAFSRGLIGMCETGEAGRTDVHCYTDIEKYCKFNLRDNILARYNHHDDMKNRLVKVCTDVPLDTVKFSVVTLFRPNISSSEMFPLNWMEYNSATDEIDHSDLFCKWDVREAQEKCMDAADQLRNSSSTCDVFVYNKRGGRPFGLLYLNYDRTAIIDDEEYIVLLTSKYWTGNSYTDDDIRACLWEMTEDLESVGIARDEAEDCFRMAGIDKFLSSAPDDDDDEDL